MNVYLVWKGEYEERGVESVWSTKEEADARAAEVSRRYGRWRKRNGQGTHAWSETCCPMLHCICRADGGYVEEYEVSGQVVQEMPLR